jgi:UDP-2-acetamido-3-amino-2,3-dideoxy-glucuronate N-acetyltransferase
MSPNIAVIGNGYWGKNLVRNFHALGVLRSVCEQRPEALEQARLQYGVAACTSPEEIWHDPEINGVAIAAPAAQHYHLGRQALLAGKDVFMEKPLALRVEEGEELVKLAASGRRILMVGHILQYHPAVLALKELIRSGHLGKIQYMYSSRLNLGKLRSEENILWSFAPHDISAILYLLDEVPMRVTASGGSYVNPQIFDTTLTTCEFQSGSKAHIFVSWLHPFKEQKLVVVGGKKMAVFDDVEQERKLVVYSHSIDWLDRVPVARRHDGAVVPLPVAEPLRRECEHFVECMLTRQKPRTDGVSGVQVLKVLDACERSLRADSHSIVVSEPIRPYFADPTAVIDPGCEIGAGTRIWHFSHIMRGAVLGRNCNLGQNVVVSPQVSIGNNVKIQNNVSVYTGVELEILCGVTVGRYAFVAAGAVVTRDIPDYALVMGVPAVQAGWMCACGVRLPEQQETTCIACGRRYRIEDGSCQEVISAGSSAVNFEVSLPLAA